VLLRLEKVEERLADLRAGHHGQLSIQNVKFKNRIAALECRKCRKIPPRQEAKHSRSKRR
jgi:hypothetical protein